MRIVEERVGVLIVDMASLDRVGIELGFSDGSKFAIEMHRVFFTHKAIVGDELIGSGEEK